jgi:hypothetical protein
MRILIGCLLLGCSFAFAAEALLVPDSEALHKLYGKSDLVSPNREGTPDSESFHLRNDIHMTVMYGSDHHACFIELTPEQPLRPQRPYHEMSWERVTEILEEIAPSAKRGKLNGGFTVCAGSPGIGDYDYEYLRITRRLRCGEDDSESNTKMYFKRDVCPKP